LIIIFEDVDLGIIGDGAVCFSVDGDSNVGRDGVGVGIGVVDVVD
jgi:hypothetical protein